MPTIIRRCTESTLECSGECDDSISVGELILGIDTVVTTLPITVIDSSTENENDTINRKWYHLSCITKVEADVIMRESPRVTKDERKSLNIEPPPNGPSEEIQDIFISLVQAYHEADPTDHRPANAVAIKVKLKEALGTFSPRTSVATSPLTKFPRPSGHPMMFSKKQSVHGRSSTRPSTVFISKPEGILRVSVAAPVAAVDMGYTSHDRRQSPDVIQLYSAMTSVVGPGSHILKPLFPDILGIAEFLLVNRAAGGVIFLGYCLLTVFFTLLLDTACWKTFPVQIFMLIGGLYLFGLVCDRVLLCKLLLSFDFWYNLGHFFADNAVRLLFYQAGFFSLSPFQMFLSSISSFLAVFLFGSCISVCDCVPRLPNSIRLILAATMTMYCVYSLINAYASTDYDYAVSPICIYVYACVVPVSLIRSLRISNIVFLFRIVYNIIRRPDTMFFLRSPICVVPYFNPETCKSVRDKPWFIFLYKIWRPRHKGVNSTPSKQVTNDIELARLSPLARNESKSPRASVLSTASKLTQRSSTISVVNPVVANESLLLVEKKQNIKGGNISSESKVNSTDIIPHDFTVNMTATVEAVFGVDRYDFEPLLGGKCSKLHQKRPLLSGILMAVGLAGYLSLSLSWNSSSLWWLSVIGILICVSLVGVIFLPQVDKRSFTKVLKTFDFWYFYLNVIALYVVYGVFCLDFQPRFTAEIYLQKFLLFIACTCVGIGVAGFASVPNMSKSGKAIMVLAILGYFVRQRIVIATNSTVYNNDPIPFLYFDISIRPLAVATNLTNIVILRLLKVLISVITVPKAIPMTSSKIHLRVV